MGLRLDSSNTRWRVTLPMDDRTLPPPPYRQLLLTPSLPSPALDVGLIRLVAPRDRLTSALAACDEVGAWPFKHIPKPERHTVVHAKALVLAVGALLPGGPTRVSVGPSTLGGMVTTFWGEFDDVTVTTLNNGTCVVIYGRYSEAVGFRGGVKHEVFEMTPDDALWQLHADFRLE